MNEREKNVRKKGNLSKKRLKTGLIVSIAVTIALCIVTGLAIADIYRYRDEAERLGNDNLQLQKDIENLQSSLSDQEQKIAEAVEQIKSELQIQTEAAEQYKEKFEDADRKLSDLKKYNDELKEALSEAQKEIDLLRDQVAGLQGSQPVYPSDAKFVALTFDDGPGKLTTPRLLEILKEKNVKATFFMLGEKAEMYPAVVKKVAEDGHAIGTHSYSHKRLTNLTPQEIAEDMNKSVRVLSDILGVAPALMRPPGGNYNDNVISYAKNSYQRIIMWSVDTRDWESRDKNKILEETFKEGRYGVKDGAIILMHDIYTETVDTVGDMIDRLIEEGYTLVTVPELLQIRAMGGEGGGVYHSLKP